MIFKMQTLEEITANFTVSIRCPSCRQKGIFVITQNNDLRAQCPVTDKDGVTEAVILGQRCCPDPQCRSHIFFGATRGQIVVSYPAETVDFDSSDLPRPVVQAFEEAITCHANNCYIASAIMVRKTLEELCRDRNAEGGNLKKRIAALGNKVVLPQELLDGIDDLRLLGNDAAHIESKTYDQIGQE